jgi:hydroxypyruvate isomerase
MRYSACIEWLFFEAETFPERVRAARKAGLDGIEFWKWTDKDVRALGEAVRETGMIATGLLAEPMVPLTDPLQHDAFIEGVKRSTEVAQRLGAATLFAQAGADLPHLTKDAQREAVVDCLGRAAESLRGSGVVLAVEPLNTRVDHPGYFLPSTSDALDIIDDVGRDEVRILYDIYHSAMMGEKTEVVLAGRLDRVAHVHLADSPGRHEPGSGTLDWQHRLDWLAAGGYSGLVGLEYQPSRSTVESLALLLGHR